MDYKKPLRKIKHFINDQKRIKRLMNQAANILPEVACIDIGASYYPHPAWEVFRRSPRCTWIAVEPNHQNLAYAKNWNYPSAINVVSTGLSESGGKKTLYVTNVDSGSSLLKPVVSEYEAHRYDLNYLYPLKEAEIDTITLDDVVKNFGAKKYLGIKLDTQGSELSILKGLNAEALKNKLICVDIEVSLKATPPMQGAAHFYEVQKFLLDLGMELVRLRSFDIDSLPKNKTGLAGFSVVNECDAVFLLRPEIAYQRGTECLRALFGFYIAYELFGEAGKLLDFIIKNDKSDTMSAKSLLLLTSYFGLFRKPK